MGRDKRIVYPDGSQRPARVGLVDGGGVTCWMLDADNNERFAFAPMGELLYGADEARTRAEAALGMCEEAMAAGFGKREHTLESALGLAAEMLECGDFPRGTKGSFKTRAAALRGTLGKYRKEAR